MANIKHSQLPGHKDIRDGDGNARVVAHTTGIDVSGSIKYQPINAPASPGEGVFYFDTSNQTLFIAVSGGAFWQSIDTTHSSTT